MARVEITDSEIVDALNAAIGTGEMAPADAFSREEIHDATGWGLPRISKHLRALKAQGQVEIVIVSRERVDGRLGPVPCYRFLRSKKAKR